MTGTTGAATSLKLVGKFTDGNTENDWEGLSPGYWRNWSPQSPGNQVNDWNEDQIIFNQAALPGPPEESQGYRTFERVFDVEAGDWLVRPGVVGSDVTMLQALQLGGDLKEGLKKNSLARQATAALLNSLEKDDSDPNGSVNYRFTTTNVLEWTKDALTANFSAVAAQVDAVVPDVDTSGWTTRQSTISGLADLFAANNNLGLYG